MDLVLYSAMVLFFGMAIWATAFPARFLYQFGCQVVGRDGRSEVRAVYGGYGFAMAIALGVVIQSEAYRNGILLCIALALGGMAAGRFISLLVDREISARMAAVLIGEAIVALALYTSIDVQL